MLIGAAVHRTLGVWRAALIGMAALVSVARSAALMGVAVRVRTLTRLAVTGVPVRCPPR